MANSSETDPESAAGPDGAAEAPLDGPAPADDAGDIADRPIRYLSLDWIRALTAEVAASEQMAEAAEHHTIGVTQVVTGGPEGDVTYHLDVRDGVAAFGAGPADPEDVKMQQTWETATAVATGALNAQEAFINGHILLFGSQQKLLDSRAVFGALDAVFASVASRTRYE